MSFDALVPPLSKLNKEVIQYVQTDTLAVGAHSVHVKYEPKSLWRSEI